MFAREAEEVGLIALNSYAAVWQNFCFSFLLKKQTEVNSDVNFFVEESQ